jgi:two-component system, response regulator PdtaR
MAQQTSLRVLIADDQESTSRVIGRLLENLGHQVVSKVVNGRLAVEQTKLLHPDIILMDIEMPELDGLNATRIIQKECPTPVVLLTAYDDPEMVRQASETGAGAYLLKPPSAREIERTMIIALSRFSDLMEVRRLNAELQSALDRVKLLSGLLPICANCKKIRNDQGYWDAVETFLGEHSEVQFSHSICPDCIDKLYPEFKPKELTGNKEPKKRGSGK